MLIFCRAAQFLLALVMMRVATTILSPTEMGRVALVLSSVAFFALFLVNPVGMFINRRLHTWQINGVAQYYLICFAIYLLAVAIVAAMVVPLLNASGLIGFGISFGWLILIVCGSLFFNTISQTALSSLNFLGASRAFVFLSVATIATSFICATLLVQLVKPAAQYWLLGLLLGQIFIGVIGVKVIFGRLRKPRYLTAAPVIHKRHLKVLFSFAWPVAIAAGLGWVQGQGYRYLLEGQLGLAQLGLFVAGYSISAGMIAGFESVLTTYFQPRLYRDVSVDQHSGKHAQAWQRYAAAVIPSLVLTVAFILMLAPELTRIFLGKNFQSAADFVIWGAIAEAARVLMGVYSLIAHIYMRTRWLILPNLVGAMLSIILCALLIPSFGAVGVGIGLAASGIAVVVLVHLLLARRVGGVTLIQPVLMAAVAAAALWLMTLGLRHFLHSTGWMLIVSMLLLVGLTYLGLQYIFLRAHLKDMREA